MSNVNLEELRKQVAEKAEANAKIIAEKAEIAKLQATLALQNNETLINAKVNLLNVSQDSQKLENLIAECTQIITDTPIADRKSRQNRKWAGKHRYGYGNQVDLVYQLCTGIMYSTQEHKDLLLAHTKLDMQLITDLVESFGNPAYYSTNNNVLVEEVPVDLNKLLQSYSVIQTELDVIVNTSKLNESNVKAEYTNARLKAETDQLLAQEAIAEADFSD